MARKPKGSIIQPIPSWNIRNMVAGGITGGTGAATFEDMGLANNATDGSWLVIWDVTIAVGAFTGTVSINPSVIGKIIPDTEGEVIGVSQPAGYSIVNPSASTFGWLWDNPTPNGLTTPAYQFMQDRGIWQWPHDFPFAAIQPGWSYAFELYGDVDDWSVSLTWEVVRFI